MGYLVEEEIQIQGMVVHKVTLMERPMGCLIAYPSDTRSVAEAGTHERTGSGSYVAVHTLDVCDES